MCITRFPSTYLFDEGCPVIETLEEIKAGVTQTLADFDPDFPR